MFLVDVFDFWPIWQLGGREWVQNDATGCGIIFHTRKTHSQKLDFLTFFDIDHIFDVFDDPWAPWGPLGPLGTHGPLGPHGPDGAHGVTWAPGQASQPASQAGGTLRPRVGEPGRAVHIHSPVRG